jgi:hypothetical protein
METLERVRTIERIKQLLDHYDISMNALDTKAGLSNGYIGKQIKINGKIGSDALQKIHCAFSEVSGDWLLGEDVPFLKTKHTYDYQRRELTAVNESTSEINYAIEKLLSTNEFEYAIKNVIEKLYPQLRHNSRDK